MGGSARLSRPSCPPWHGFSAGKEEAPGWQLQGSGCGSYFSGWEGTTQGALPPPRQELRVLPQPGQDLGLMFDLEVEPSSPKHPACLGTPDPETHRVNTSLSLSLSALLSIFPAAKNNLAPRMGSLLGVARGTRIFSGSVVQSYFLFSSGFGWCWDFWVIPSPNAHGAPGPIPCGCWGNSWGFRGLSPNLH